MSTYSSLSYFELAPALLKKAHAHNKSLKFVNEWLEEHNLCSYVELSSKESIRLQELFAVRLVLTMEPLPTEW
jgi:hypothetical protein